MPREICVIVDEQGNVTVEGKGFTDADCKKLSADIEKELGTVERMTTKPEFHRAATVTRTVPS